MPRRQLVFWLVAFVLIGSVVVGNAQSPDGTVIEFWHPWAYDPEATTINTLVDEFNASKNARIRINAVAFETYEDLRQAVVAAPTHPNLFLAFQLEATQYFADGWIINLSPLMADSDTTSWNPRLLNLFATEDSNQMGIPAQISAQVLAVNMTMLEELGYDAPPQTFEDFYGIACASQNGVPLKAGASDFESFLAGFGGRVFENSKYVFDSPQTLNTLAFYQFLFADGCAYLPELGFGGVSDFARQNTPLAQVTSFNLPYIRREMGNNPPEWIVTTTPYIDNHQSLQIFTPALVIADDTPELENAAWQFITFLMQPENQALWVNQTGYLPLNTQVNTDTPYLSQVIEFLNNPDIILFQSPPEPSYHLGREFISEAVTDVTENGRDVSEIADRLQSQATALQAEFMSQ